MHVCARVFGTFGRDKGKGGVKIFVCNSNRIANPEFVRCGLKIRPRSAGFVIPPKRAPDLKSRMIIIEKL